MSPARFRFVPEPGFRKVNAVLDFIKVDAMLYKFPAAAALAALLSLSAAEAATVSRVVLKANDTTAQIGTRVDPYLDWINNTGVNEGVAGADSLVNNGIDLKDSWVDSNWGLVSSVRVSMYAQGNEVAYLEFAAAGTTKTNFFDLANLTASTWGTTGFPGQDLVNPFFSGQFFSIAGSIGNDRHWYVNNNWGGCGIDRGWFVVLDDTASPGYVCSWENIGVTRTGSNDRGFMYSMRAGASPDHQNFNNPGIGIADLFAVTVTYDDANVVPLPGAGGLLLTVMGGMAVLRRRKRTAP